MQPIPFFVKEIITTFQKNNFEIYIVGGSVRDLLVGRPVKDWDFTTNATPEQIIQLFEHTFYDNNFGTVGIVSPHDHQQHEKGLLEKVPIYEVTTFRTEASYTDSRRPDTVSWGKTLSEDLQRRDFTINAIAATFDHKNNLKYIDPQQGQADIKARIIRTVGDPQERFSEDALRMLRAIRIGAQLGFTIEGETLAAIKTHASLIQKISFERIRDELLKIVVTPYTTQALTLLHTQGLMQYFLPELETARGIEQAGHHHDDVWVHSLKSLEYCPSLDPIVRFATLIHDIGKPSTRRFVCRSCGQIFELTISTDKQITCPHCHYANEYRDSVMFHNHEVVGARIASHIAKRLRFSSNEIDKIFKLVRFHMFTVDERQTDKAIRRFIRNVGKENLDDMVDLRIGDRLGGGARETSWRLERFKKLLVEVQKQPFTVHDLKITGTQVMDVLNIPPSRAVGNILNYLFSLIEEGQIKNTETELSQTLINLNTDPALLSQITQSAPIPPQT